MARSYGQGFRPGYKDGANFDMPTIRGGAGFQSSLGDTVNLGNAYGSLRKSGTRFDELAATSVANRAAERATATEMEAAAHATGLSTMADVKSNQMIAEAQEEAAKAQASGSMMGSAFGAIGSIGGALIGLSDESTKHTVERIEDALATLRDLKPVTFYYKEEYSMSPERMHHGFIAQDYAKVMPDATYYDEELGKMCIDTSELIGLLVRSVQQLETRVARMEAANALVGAK
jgi:predicted nucleic acid-binding protein